MANDTRPSGLIPITSPYGIVRLTLYRANTALALYRFQPVVLNNSGQVETVAVGANNPILGSIIGFTDVNQAGLPSGLTSLSQAAFLPASTDAFVAVADDPNQQFLIEEDTGGSVLATTNIGNVGDFTYIDAGTGNSITGASYAVLDRSTVATGTGGALQLIGVQNITNQDGTTNAPGNYCQWIVRIANHQLNGTKLGVSV